MGDTCQGGQFDGYTLTTPRDRQLCSEGGGSIISGGSDPVSGCGASAVSGFARGSGQQLSTQNLYSARSLFGGSEEMAMLQRLSAASVPAVERVLDADPERAHRLVDALARLEEISARMVSGQGDEPALTEAEFDDFSDLARTMADDSADDEFTGLVRETLERARPFVGMPVGEAARRLTPELDVGDIHSGTTAVEISLPRLELHPDPLGPLVRPDRDLWTVGLDHLGLADLIRAGQAIDDKAQGLGGLPGADQGGLEAVPGVAGGYRQRYAGCAIYWSDATGAHEVHGEIQRKYEAVNGPVRLGLPTTDETGTPDGRGRFNHFAKNASIYWTPTTGPFWIAGAVRFRWASLGFERSALGYPVVDQQVMSGLYPQDDVDIEWIKFESGMIAADHGNAQVALAASATPRQLADAFYTMVERNMHSESFEIGFISVTARPGLFGVDILGIEPGVYNFWSTSPRTLHLKVRGFVSLPVVPDPSWEVELKVQFSAVWPTQLFGAPTVKTLVARLVWSRIHVEGVFPETIASSIGTSIHDTFSATPSGEMVVADLPTGENQRGRGSLDLLDAALMQDGTLNVFVNPIPDVMGRLRQMLGQNKVNQTLEEL